MGAVAITIAAVAVVGTAPAFMLPTITSPVVVGSALEGLGILAYAALVLVTVVVASRWAAQALDVEAGRDSAARTRDMNAPRSGA